MKRKHFFKSLAALIASTQITNIPVVEPQKELLDVLLADVVLDKEDPSPESYYVIHAIDRCKIDAPVCTLTHVTTGKIKSEVLTVRKYKTIMRRTSPDGRYTALLGFGVDPFRE